MSSGKSWIFYTMALLITEMVSVRSVSLAQGQGIIQGKALSGAVSSSFRAVAVAKDERGVTDTARIFQTSLYGGTAFRLMGLPLDRTFWISILNADGKAIKTVAARVDSMHNPLDLSIDLSEGSSMGGINGMVSASGQVSHYMALDRYVYTSADTLHIRYRIENLGQIPVVFNFSDAQCYDFSIQREDVPIWRWSDGRMFAQVAGSLELASGEGITYEAGLDLASLDLSVDVRYTLKGYLTTFPTETGERLPEMELSFFMRSTASLNADVQVGSPVTVDGISGGPLIFDTESPVDPLQCLMEILPYPDNPAASIPGYRFIQAVDLLLEAALGRMVTSLKVQIPYEERRLEGLNIQEPNIQMFMLNLEGDVLQWQKVPSEVDQSENYVIGSPRGFGPIGLFAIPGTGLIGDFNSDGKVGFEDFLSFVKGYGKRAGDPDFLPELDLNEDSEVGFKDFLFFAKHYGEALPK